MKKRAAAWLKPVALYGIGFGLLAFVIWRNWLPKGNNPGLQGLLNQQPDYLAFAALALCGAFVYGTQLIRWYFLVRALDLPFSLYNAFRLGFVGLFYNSFLPGSVGGDLVKAFFIATDHPERKAAAVSTVVADRLLGLFGLIWLSAAIGGALWLKGEPLIANNEYLRNIILICSSLTGFAVFMWVVLGFLPQRRVDRFAGRLAHIPKLGKTLEEMWYTVWTYRQRPKVIYSLIALTGCCHVAMVFMFDFAVQVFPVKDPGTLQEHFVICPVGYIAQAFFPAPGGVGGAEAIFGYLYTLLGRPESTGVVARLTVRVLEWSFGFIGYMVYLRMKKELPVIEQGETIGHAAFGDDEPKPQADLVK